MPHPAVAVESEDCGKNADPFAIRSMASTRATVRALRGPLGQIAVLAGFQPTPADEMPVSDQTTAADRAPAPSSPSDDQRAAISELIVELLDIDEERGDEPRDWGAWCRDYACVASFDELDELGAARLINGLERMIGHHGKPEAA